MPTNLVRTPEEERLWAKAKARVEEEYGDEAELGNEHFYRLVNGIYQKMKSGGATGKLKKAYVVFGSVAPHLRGGHAIQGYMQRRHRAESRAAGQAALFDASNMPTGEPGPLPLRAMASTAPAVVSAAPETPMPPLPGMTPADADAGRGRRFHDVGEKIGGARKDVAELRRQFAADPGADNLAALEDQDPDAAARALNKELLWPKPAFAALRAEGRSAGWVTLARSAWEATAGKPPLFTPESRRNYLRGVETLRDLIEGSQSEQQLAERLAELRRLVQRAESRNPEPPLTQYEQALDGYLQASGKVRDWLVGKAKVRGSGAYPLIHSALRGWPQSEDERWAIIEGWWGEKARKPRSHADAETGAAEKWHPLTPKQYERRGDVPPIIIHSAADYLDLFGLRGVEFGNWMEDAASQVHVNRCAEAFVDLAETLGLRRQDVSLNGRLALAFGARGSGAAAAHYEPGKTVINLTKLGGAGTLAHEWAHALDDILHRVEPEALSQHVTDMSYNALQRAQSPVLQAVGGVMAAIYEGQATVPHKVGTSVHSRWPAVDDFIRLARSEHEAALNDAALDAPASSPGQLALEKVLAAYPRTSLKKIKKIADYIGTRTGEPTLQIPTGTSAFFADAANRGGYWKRPHELFARAFETYIVDAMAEQGRGNNYLAYDVNYSRPGTPYPQGEERAALKSAFDGLFAAIRATGTMAKALQLLDDEAPPKARALVAFGVVGRLGKAWIEVPLQDQVAGAAAERPAPPPEDAAPDGPDEPPLQKGLLAQLWQGFGTILTSLQKSHSGGEFQRLQKNKAPLTEEERAEVMAAKAVWHHGPHGEETPAVWKSVDPKTGKVTYITHTHRAYNTAPTLKGAIRRFHDFIKGTA